MGEADLQDTAYELLALGFRYVFAALAALTLLRAMWMMRRDHRAHRRTLRALPDAGLVGELVELSSGKGQPLPREGMLGSGRSCDVRFDGLRRRELEFAFRPGFGLRLFPIHRRGQATLDDVPLESRDAHALHGTVLNIRGAEYRFRFFAGLDLPLREAPPQLPAQAEPGAWDIAGDLPGFEMGEGLPGAEPQQPFPPLAPPLQDPSQWTWQYAPFPGGQPLPEEVQPIPELAEDQLMDAPPQPGQAQDAPDEDWWPNV